MKKVLFLGGLNPGGAEHQMVVLASLLKHDGYDVTYLCGGKDVFFQNVLERAGIPILRIQENEFTSLLKLNIPRTMIIMYGVFKRGKYDTVISFLGLWNFVNCFYAKKKFTKHKCITGIRNNRDSVFLAPLERFYTHFEKYSDFIISNSNNAKKTFSNHFPEHADKLMTIYNIVDISDTYSQYIVKRNNKLHIIVPASYRDVKNPMGLLNALALMGDEEKKRIIIDWYGNIKTGQSCYEKMRAFIREKELSDVIRLFDSTKDIASRIGEADMVGLFSSSEGLPNSICEGMMLSKPIVMTKVSDYDVLVDSTNGFLCDWDNPQSIREALSNAMSLSDEDLFARGICSKRKADTLFSKEVIIKLWKQII